MYCIKRIPFHQRKERPQDVGGGGEVQKYLVHCSVNGVLSQGIRCAVIRYKVCR